MLRVNVVHPVHVALEMFVSHYTMSSHVIYVIGKGIINYLN